MKAPVTGSAEAQATPTRAGPPEAAVPLARAGPPEAAALLARAGNISPIPSIQIPWADFPPAVIDACANEQVASRKNRRDLNKMLAHYLVKMKRYDRSTYTKDILRITVV